MKGIQHGKSYGSLDDTVILIEADESTPLLVDRSRCRDSDGNNNDYGEEKSLMRYGSSMWSFRSRSPSQGSGSSTKSFKSHFWELKVLTFALVVMAGLGIAIYLLIIESRFPSITFSLDLVHHDTWSVKQLPMGHQLNPNTVDSVIVTQTGSRNCDNSYECMNILQEMQNNYSRHEELPYNFLIGSEGQVFEVRGWGFESGLTQVKQSQSLVIGIMGNFDYSPPSPGLLQTVNFLIVESARRRKLKMPYRVYGLRKFCADCHDGENIRE